MGCEGAHYIWVDKLVRSANVPNPAGQETQILSRPQFVQDTFITLESLDPHQYDPS